MRRALTANQLQHPVAGYGIEPSSLGALLDARPTLLVFLRHFG